MKTLVSGIIGAVAAAAAWGVLKHTMQQDFPYLALVVGLVTGFAVRSAAGSAGESVGRGAMAAVLALAACIGGDFAYVQYMKNVNKDAGQPQELAKAREAASAAEDDSDADDAEDADLPVIDAPVDVSDRADLASGPIRMGKAPSGADDMLDLVWLCGSGILAYVFGKGAGKGAVAQTSEDSAPAESEGDQEEQQQGDA